MNPFLKVPKTKKRFSLLEILSILERPFSLEEKYNFNNRSCNPSFHQYINHWLDEALKLQESHSLLTHLKELRDAFANYSLKNLDERQKILKKSIRLLNETKSLAFLKRDIQYIKGVGPKKASELKKLEITTARDLLMHFPRRYEDRSQFIPISKVKAGECVTVKGRIMARDNKIIPKRMSITSILVNDGTDKILGVWFNQPYIKEFLPVGKEVILSGRVTEHKEKQIAHPVFELLGDNNPVHTGRIVPLYPLTKEISMRYLRFLVWQILESSSDYLIEYLPEELLLKRNLMNFPLALKEIHFPQSMEKKDEARRRFIYEEFLFLQIGLLLMKKKNMKRNGGGIKFKGKGNLVERLEEVLPFSLTDSQKKVLDKIREDMTSKNRMMRLLHGEVGSGKTVIAFGAFLIAKESGYQSIIMAPTAILAGQHYLTLQKFGSPFGIEIGLLISGQRKKEREEVLKKVKEGEIDVLVGTHALLSKKLKFKRLGLAVIDEEQRFGVLQKAHFEKMFGERLEILVMSATPIPRSLALALYGDMDISTLDELPPLRAKTLTFWIKEEEKNRVYNFAREELDKGRQAFIITPVIEKSKKLEVSSAMKIFELLKSEIFSSYKVSLLHGRMKKKDQEDIMDKFRNKKIDILVATSLVEIGIDIPSATVMVILNAERFGLTQLHQLRGRIGRGEYNSYCILVSTPKTEEGRRRLEAMVSSSDGFEIAEEDLEIRGPGELLGTKQHGFFETKFGNILYYTKLLEEAREDAEWFLKEDPRLQKYCMVKNTLIDKFPYTEKLFVK